MRHSSFSRSKSKRWQRLTAFLTAVAMVAGFLPFQALTVMADPDPNPAPEGTEFTVVLNDDDNMDTRWMSIQYKTSDDGEWIDLDDEEISVTPTENGYECKFTIAGDGYLDIKYDLGINELNDVKLANADGSEAVSIKSTCYNSDGPSVTYHYDDFTEGKHCFIFNLESEYPYFFEIHTEGRGSISFDKTTLPHHISEDGRTYEIFSKTSSLTIGIVPNSSSDVLKEIRIAQENDKDIVITESGDTADANGITFDDDTLTFTISGASGEYCGVSLFFSGITQYDDDTIIENNVVINEGEKLIVNNCTLEIANTGSLTIMKDGNLIFMNANAALIGADKITVEKDAILSIGFKAPVPDGISVYDPEGMPLNDFNENWEEFLFDGEIWKQRVWDNPEEDPNETRVTDPITIDYGLVIEGGKSYRIVNCAVDIGENGSITIQPGGSLILEGTNATIRNADNKIIPQGGADLCFDGCNNVPEGIILYDSADNPMDAAQFGGFERFSYDEQANIWKQNNFNPRVFEISIENSFLANATLIYSVKYKVNGTDEWLPATIPVDDQFPSKDNVSNGTVTIDNNQEELQSLVFELPFELWENDANPKIDIQITITDNENLTLTDASLGRPQDQESIVFKGTVNNAPYTNTDYVTTNNDGNSVITLTDLDINETLHDFHFTLENKAFSFDNYYGLDLRVRYDKGYTLSEDGKTLTFNCFNGNQIIVSNASEMLIQPTNESVKIWSTSADFSFTAVTDPGYTAYYSIIKADDSGESFALSEAAYAVEVADTGKDSAVQAELNFVMANIQFSDYTMISPYPGAFTNWDKDYTLEPTSFEILYEGKGKVTITLIGEGSKWSGYEGGEDNKFFIIETPSQVMLTFESYEGYEVNPVLCGGDPLTNWVLPLENGSYTTTLQTEKTNLNEPFVPEGTPIGSSSAIFSGATGLTDTNTNDNEIVVNYAHGFVTVNNTTSEAWTYNYDSNTNTVTVECNGISFTPSPNENFYSTVKINDQVQEAKETYYRDPVGPNLKVDVSFTGPTYTLEFGSVNKIITEPDIDTTNNTIDLTVKETGVMKVQYNGLLILDGPNASVEGKIVFEPESMIAFVNGAKVPDGMILYDSYGEELVGVESFDEWTQFKYVNGYKWTRVSNSVIDNATFSYSATTIIQNAVTVHDNDSCKIDNCKLTISTETKDLGQIKISGYDSYQGGDTISTASSEEVSAYGFVLEGTSFACKIMPVEGYRFSIRINGTPLALDSNMLTKGDDGYWTLNYTDIARGAKVQLEVGFDPLPELKLVSADNSGYGYDSQTKTLTFTNGTVKINNDTNPFPNGPTVPTKMSSDISFTITPNDTFVCIVTLPGNPQVYIPSQTTYTLKASDLMSDSNGNYNELRFEFRQLTANDYAKVEFESESKYTDEGANYVLSYANGSVSIPKDMVVGEPEYADNKTTFTIVQSVTELPITFLPAVGYTPKLEEFGPDYNQNPVGEWHRELTITKTTSGNTVSYSYTLPINPIAGAEPTRLRVSFTQTNFLQTKVTYNYDGEIAAIEIGGNMLPDGELDNTVVEYGKPLSTTASNTKQYVKYIDGVPYVEMQLSITFNYFMSELKVSVDGGDTWLDYTEELPDTYDELLEAFGAQHTNISIWVPVSDSYMIYTKAYEAVNTEEQTQVAVGNFLWFYDAEHEGNDDYVKNAKLEIVQVVVDGTTYTENDIVAGSAISWGDIIKDGKIIGGEAVLPAGSYVTMKLIPDYGTQLVKLGLNGGGFTPDQDEMYTYSFNVGPGNFHLNADFEKVDDVVDSDATDVISAGTIKLDDNEGAITNGTAVLFVGDTEPEDAEKTLFENQAATAGVEVADYLNISLKQVVYQGVGKDENVVYSGDGQNVWDSNLSQLDNEATIGLKLKDGIDPTTVKVLHYHGGVVEVLDAQYDAATNTLSFQTDSFSDYAIAYKANVYDVTVENGTADKATAAAGNTITLTANAAPTGQAFDKWTADSDSVTFSDAESPNTTFVMPTNNVVITANYADVYSITVTDGTASSETAIAGKTITLTAGAAPEGKTFDKWEVTSENVTLASAASATTTFTMPEGNVEVKATYKDVYAVTVTSGTASPASAAEGDTVTLTAGAAPAGKEFDKWDVTSGSISLASATSATTTFTMPASAVAVTATYKDIKYTVTFNANGHGTAPAAQTVTSGSKATKPTDPTASGYTFGGWYTDSACTKAYSFDTAVTANITLYAKWTAVTTPAPSTPSPTPSPTPEPTPTPTPEPEIVPSAELIPSGTAHVQDAGDVPVSVDPETGIMTLGTTGQSKRLEEIVIDFENTTGLSGTMEYRVHVQDIGWMDWTEAGNPAGTEGISKRIEAIEIRLTGELADYYSVEYCVHIQDYGDMQGWVADGALAGTTGESKRIEQIKVRIVPKGSGDSMSVKYRVHIQDFGWEGSYASGGSVSGTSGQSKRLEGIEIFLTGGQYSGGIQYKTHVQDIGWESSWSKNGEMSGTQGQSKRLEGISIELYGEVAEYYDIYYRVHAQDVGWMGWAKNGEYAGTAGRSARLEGIQIVLVPKGSPAPGATYEGITAVTDKAFIEGF